MFDLFRSRAKIVRYMLGALLVVVALSMVTYLIPGFGGSMGGNRGDTVIAQIGDQQITTQDVRERVQLVKDKKEVPPQMLAFYVPEIVDSMIREKAMEYEAQRLGIQVTAQDVANYIAKAIPQLFPNGRFVGTEMYAQFLGQQHLTIAEFEDSVRAELLTNKLADLNKQSVVVTPDEVLNAYRERNDKIQLEYFALDADKYRSEVHITPEDVQKYFDASRAQFNIPEQRDLLVLTADQESVAKRIQLPEADLLRAYNANKDHFRLPERVHVRHILLTTAGKPAADVPKIQAKAEDILKQLKAGADFAELAKKDSEDPGSAANGGDLNWIQHGQTVPEFDHAAFSLKPGELSGVIKTQYGFHIIQVLAKEEARLKPFEEVKDQIEIQLRQQVARDTLERLMDQAHEAIAHDPANAEQIAHSLQLDVIKVDKSSAGQPIAGLGSSPELQEAISSAQKGGVTQVVALPGNKLAFAIVTNIYPTRPAELPEVQAQIEKRLEAAKLNGILEEHAREAMDKVAASGDIKKVAQQFGAEVKSTQEFTRLGAADGIGSASMLTKGFVQPVGSFFGPVAFGQKRFICRVEQHIPADMGKFREQAETLRAGLKSGKAQQREELFTDSIVNALIRDGKVKRHDDTIASFLAAYKS